MKVTVIDWVEYEASELEEPWRNNMGQMGGFFAEGMRWKDYLKQFEESYHPFAEAIREAVLKQELRVGGDRHQDDWVPIFNNGDYATYSFRGWGDLMAAIWSEEENKDYSYMDFYMSCLIKEEEDNES